eukprot:CAMPEP_0177646502 /NCGR_PEP_ID=MMETSP0447-20121125/9807_1 /TAXON_ID=0 /ORGANISM="Stygamoeba regulata, Strain BSH-02190019" /LENGTH=1205 /DNA_ID=CAMNT_0019149037 /DNA_START=111 /DNA_END=3730 /DNA_ORIENTATION=+
MSEPPHAWKPQHVKILIEAFKASLRDGAVAFPDLKQALFIFRQLSSSWVQLEDAHDPPSTALGKITKDAVPDLVIFLSQRLLELTAAARVDGEGPRLLSLKTPSAYIPHAYALTFWQANFDNALEVPFDRLMVSLEARYALKLTGPERLMLQDVLAVNSSVSATAFGLLTVDVGVLAAVLLRTRPLALYDDASSLPRTLFLEGVTKAHMNTVWSVLSRYCVPRQWVPYGSGILVEVESEPAALLVKAVLVDLQDRKSIPIPSLQWTTPPPCTVGGAMLRGLKRDGQRGAALAVLKQVIAEAEQHYMHLRVLGSNAPRPETLKLDSSREVQQPPGPLSPTWKRREASVRTIVALTGSGIAGSSSDTVDAFTSPPLVIGGALPAVCSDMCSSGDLQGFSTFNASPLPEGHNSDSAIAIRDSGNASPLDPPPAKHAKARASRALSPRDAPTRFCVAPAWHAGGAERARGEPNQPIISEPGPALLPHARPRQGGGSDALIIRMRHKSAISPRSVDRAKSDDGLEQSVLGSSQRATDAPAPAGQDGGLRTVLQWAGALEHWLPVRCLRDQHWLGRFITLTTSFLEKLQFSMPDDDASAQVRCVSPPRASAGRGGGGGGGGGGGSSGMADRVSRVLSKEEIHKARATTVAAAQRPRRKVKDASTSDDAEARLSLCLKTGDFSLLESVSPPRSSDRAAKHHGGRDEYLRELAVLKSRRDALDMMERDLSAGAAAHRAGSPTRPVPPRVHRTPPREGLAGGTGEAGSTGSTGGGAGGIGSTGGSTGGAGSTSGSTGGEGELVGLLYTQVACGKCGHSQPLHEHVSQARSCVRGSVLRRRLAERYDTRRVCVAQRAVRRWLLRRRLRTLAECLRASGLSQAQNRYDIIKEIVDSERVYVENLQVALVHFKEPLEEMHEAKAHAGAQGFGVDELFEIFGIMDAILDLNSLLLADLTERWEESQDNTTIAIGDIFQRHVRYLRLYRPYICSYDRAMDTLRRHHSSALSSFLSSLELQPEVKGLPLPSYLIMPVQRLPRYRLLIENLLKHTPPHIPDHCRLVDVAEQLMETIDSINESKRQADNRLRLVRIEASLKGLTTPLHNTWRQFVNEGALLQVKDSKRVATYCFLFHDLLLITKAEKAERKFHVREVHEMSSAVEVRAGGAEGGGSSSDEVGTAYPLEVLIPGWEEPTHLLFHCASFAEQARWQQAFGGLRG